MIWLSYLSRFSHRLILTCIPLVSSLSKIWKLLSIIMLSNAAWEIFGIKFSESKASLVLTQLNQPVSVDSNISTTSLFVGRERMTFDISFSMQPFKILAELRFRRTSLWILCILSDQFSKILHSRQVSRKLCETLLKCSCWIKNCTKTFLLLNGGCRRYCS